MPKLFKPKLLIGSTGAKSGHKHIEYYVTEALLPFGYLLFPPVCLSSQPASQIFSQVYIELRLPNHPTLTPLIIEHYQGNDIHTSLGPYWQQPGRNILVRHLVDVPEPSSILNHEGLEKLHRAFFCGEPVVFSFLLYFCQTFELGDDIPSFIPPNASTYPSIMRNEMTWRDLLGYFRTSSALHTYHERFPEDKTRAEDTRFLEADLAVVEPGAGEDTVLLLVDVDRNEIHFLILYNR